jgi:hypothetical protein
VSGGALSVTGTTYVGATSKPTVFTQSGGGVTSGSGLYVQSASRYEQSGGTLTVGGTSDLVVSNGSRYVLSGGTATIGDELIISGSGDQYIQSGGSLTVPDIRGRAGGRLEVRGGTLAVTKRFDLASTATLDFAGGNATVNVSQYGVVDLGLGSVMNAGNTTYTAGFQSESYFPAGFNPYTAFKSFSSQGLVHTAGTTLVVPGNFTMKAIADRVDRMRIEGVLQSKTEDGWDSDFTISQGGIEVAAGGSFMVGSSSSWRTLNVNANSSVSGGALSVTGTTYVGATSKPTVFTQSGGGVTSGSGLYV